MSDYVTGLKADAEESARYFNFSINAKTEQQKVLERMLTERGIAPQAIADIACGGGGASVHLSELFPQARFTLVDANESAISLARHATEGIEATCAVGDIYNLGLDSESFDLVICWQTLSWLEKPDAALRELVRICKPSGLILASSLFNLLHDVDVYSKVIDHTRPSSAIGINYTYNTYSLRTIREWLTGMVTDFTIHKFCIPMDLNHNGRGIGTYTVKTDDGERLQLSAGMLLNWGILEVKK